MVAQVHAPNGISIGSPVFVRLAVVTNRQRQTDRQTDAHTDHATSVTISRTVMLCMRCGLTIQHVT